jgi:hypothetical protein
MSGRPIENMSTSALNILGKKLPGGLVFADRFLFGRPDESRLLVIYRPWAAVTDLIARIGDEATLRLLFNYDINLANFGRACARGSIADRVFQINEFSGTPYALQPFKRAVVPHHFIAKQSTTAVEFCRDAKSPERTTIATRSTDQQEVERALFD